MPVLKEKVRATVQLACMLGWLPQLSLAPRGANSRPKPLRFSTGILCNESSQRIIVVDQPVAPCLGLMHQRHRSARLSGDSLKGSANRFGVNAAH